jgi:hypothetical protein
MKLSTEPRADLFFPVIFLLLAGAYITWTWNHELAGMGGDNAVYLLTADYFSPWSSPSAVAKHFAQHSPYPPLYPFVLGLFGGNKSVLVAHLITTCSLLLGFIVLRMWFLSLGIGRMTATFAMTLFALLPGTIKTSMFIWSENQYLLLTLLALTMTVRFEERRNSLYLLAAALAIGGATITRSAGVSLAASFCLYLLIHRPNRAMIMGLLATLPFTVILFIKNFSNASRGTSYLEAFQAHYRGDPVAKLITQVKVESNALWHGWISNFEPAALSFLIMLFFIVCLLGMAIRLYQKRLDSFYLLFYFSLILVWPYPAEAKRMMYVILPILLGQGILLLNHLSRLAVSKKTLQPALIFLILLLVISLPGTLFIFGRFTQPVPAELEQYKRNKYFYYMNQNVVRLNILNVKILFEDLRSLDAKLPPKAIIYGVKPSIISFHANRLALQPPGPNSDWSSFLSKTTGSSDTYFYLMGITSPSIKTPYYPLELIRDRLEILNVANTYEGEDAPVVAFLAKVKK